MANYEQLKAAINAAIYTNTQRAITGDVLNAMLKSMVDALGNGYQYKGKATPETNPGTPDSNVVYIASAPGTYVAFGGLVVAEGELAFLKWNGTWTKDAVTVSAGAGAIGITSQQDGALVFTFSNGDTVTVDLNHDHPSYLKYVYLESESEVPSTPEATTLYLIKETEEDE